MNSKRIIHIIFVVSLILVSGFAVTPASAKAPVIIEGPYTWSGDVYNECGITIDGYTNGTQRTKIWFDENGQIDKAQNFLNVVETWSANGKTLEFTQHYPIHVSIETYPDGYVVFLGVTIYKIPGHGVVMQAAGHYSYTITFDAEGNLIVLDPIKMVGHWEADWAPICEYFAP
jgi:hypothetical protein